MSEDILIVQDLVKHYPIRKGIVPRTVGHVRAVDGVSFSIPHGKTLGLVGESGCGKTTVGRTILRLIEPTSGNVVFNGQQVFSLADSQMQRLRREMQIIFQDPYGSLNPRMTIGAALTEPLVVHGVVGSGSVTATEGSGSARWRSEKNRAHDRVAELLTLVGLSAESANRYPHEFSGGQRQRIGIARALTVNPKFIVCDEAVSALDVSIQAQILNLLVDLQRRFGLTYLFIAHDLAVVKHIADRTVVMYLGKIVEEAETDELFANPLHPYTQALLASNPSPVPSLRKPGTKPTGDIASPIAPPAGCSFHPRCPIAIEECKQSEPALTEIVPGHRVACIRTEVTAMTRIKNSAG
jgi:oligopeptide/dipeptide ABC transporter ATP-binding protein